MIADGYIDLFVAKTLWSSPLPHKGDGTFEDVGLPPKSQWT